MLLDPDISPGIDDPRDTQDRSDWQDHMAEVEEEILLVASVVAQRLGLDQVMVLQVLQEREIVLHEADKDYLP